MPAPYWIVGPGRLGLSIGSVLIDSGIAAELLFIGRQQQAPQHPVMSRSGYATALASPPQPGTRIVLAVPDGAIAGLADEIARLGAPGDGCVALHLSGVQTAQVLAPLAQRGYAVGSLHPLQTVADPGQGAGRLRGSFFTFEGDDRARAAAAEVVEAAGGEMLEVRAADKARYHAACVFASNYIIACAAAAARLLGEAAGTGREEALRALQPLWRGAVSNLEELGLPRALTGPLARGDAETVRKHMATLRGDTRLLYGRLALEALTLSRELGLAAEVADAIEVEIRECIEGRGESE